MGLAQEFRVDAQFRGFKKRGILIAVEGGDRGGKSTQCMRLKEWFTDKQGGSIEYLKFPERSTPIGKIIDDYLCKRVELSDEAVHLLFSANRWELVEKMKTYLELGVNVILDRYAYSGVAYSSAKGLDLKWCMAPDSGLPEPDIIFEIYLPQETRGLRHGFGEERYETLSFQDRVCESYEALHCHHLETSQSPWIRIDGSVSPEEVTGSIIEKLSKILEEFDNIQPLGALRWISN